MLNKDMLNLMLMLPTEMDQAWRILLRKSDCTLVRLARIPFTLEIFRDKINAIFINQQDDFSSSSLHELNIRKYIFYVFFCLHQFPICAHFLLTKTFISWKDRSR